MKVGLVDFSTHGGKIKFEFLKAYYFMKVGLVVLSTHGGENQINFFV